MVAKEFPKEWPPILVREFKDIKGAYLVIRDIVKSINDLRKLIVEVDSTKGNPSFHANPGGTDQTGIADGVWTKVVLNTEVFDTEDDFDSVTNYRFTPSIPGKYLLIGKVQWLSIEVTHFGRCALYKNGVVSQHSTRVEGGSTDSPLALVVAILEANGTTDHFELFAFHSDTAGVRDINGPASLTNFSGFRIGP